MDGPTCPCCFKNYEKSLLETAAADSWLGAFCGTCEPSDVEKALARQGSDPNYRTSKGLPVPPITWLLTKEEITTSAAEIVAATKANLDAIAALPLTDVTFENTIKRLMLPPNYKTNSKVTACKFLQHCSVDKGVREAAAAAGEALANTRVEGRMRKDVYARVVAFGDTDECKGLNTYDRHFYDASRGDFERAGLALSPKDASTLKVLLKADSECCGAFGKNLGNNDTVLWFSKDELKGCTDAFIAERYDEVKKMVKITTKYPDMIPIGKNCEVAATRKAVTAAYEGPTAFANNLDLVAEGVNIRLKIAILMGYPSWAEYITSTRMSGSYKAVDDFLSGLEEKVVVAADLDLETLLRAKEEHCEKIGEEFDGFVNAWDTGFYQNRVTIEDFGVDDNEVKKYFPLGHVVETTLKIYQELLGLKFDELDAGTFWCWHKEVRCFSVSDAESSDHVGHFYLDLHPRTGKYGHAAIFHQVKNDGEHGAVDAMLCNLPPPSSDGTPSLLSHYSVVTFFHEFGHIMHGLCSEGGGNSTRLAKCPRDFVEAPSQMLENWVWQESILERVSCHHETGDQLPKKLLEDLVKAKNVFVSLNTLRQIYLSRLDLTIHGEKDSVPADAAGLQSLVDELRPRISLIKNPEGNCMLRTFGHLMNQYSASYYGYLWAEVISADMFDSRFSKDCMDKTAGMDYRKDVLAVGGVGKIKDHLTKFLGGREPNDAAFLKSRGLS